MCIYINAHRKVYFLISINKNGIILSILSITYIFSLTIGPRPSRSIQMDLTNFFKYNIPEHGSVIIYLTNALLMYI